MKTAAIFALVIVVAIISFSMGSSAGWGGLLMMMMGKFVLLVTLPAATAILAVLAGVYALGAKASKAKPNWPFFFKGCGIVYILTIVGSVLFALDAISRGFH